MSALAKGGGVRHEIRLGGAHRGGLEGVEGWKGTGGRGVMLRVRRGMGGGGGEGVIYPTAGLLNS